jgi:hypothetical protein
VNRFHGLVARARNEASGRHTSRPVGGARSRVAAIVAAGALLALAATIAGPVGAGAAVATKPKAGGSTTTVPTTTLAPTTTTAPVPALPAPPAPGGSVAWAPQGRSVLGRPLLYTGSSGGGFVAWMDPQLARPVVVPGSGDPGGPWPWGGQVAPESRGFLLAAFNGGFKWGDFSGGVLTFGTAFRGLAPGQASLIVYSDGTFTVGAWGRDNDPAKQAVGVRQNLQLLVDGGRPTPETGSLGAWGASVAGAATMRSSVGVDANGALVWAGGRLTPADLANAQVSAGAVRAMELDINPDWVNFNSYDVAADGSVHGNGLYGATGADRYLHPDGRDFVAVMVRGTVLPGATAQLGIAPIKGEVRAG